MKRYYQSIKLAQLLTKFSMQTISESEKQELASLIKKTGIDVDTIIRKATQNLYPDDQESDTRAGERMLASILNDINRPKRRLNVFMRYAAIAIILLSISGGIYILRSGNIPATQEIVSLQKNQIILEYPSGGKVVLTDKTNLQDVLSQLPASVIPKTDSIIPSMYKITVARGSTYSLTLEDSTKILLYPGSELHLPTSFNTKDRSVTLHGEGYFQVRHDSSRPFIVNAGTASIKVLGTSFNVRAYQDEETVEAVLVKGRVMMNQSELAPGQMGELNNETQQVVIRNVDASIYSMRAQGMFIFDNKTLGEIMQEFSLWFEFDYEFEDTGLQNKKFRLKIPQTEDFNKLMEMMGMTEEIRFSISGKHITVMHGKAEEKQ